MLEKGNVMQNFMVLLFVGAVTVAQAVTVPEAIARALPVSSDRLRVEEEVAVACCSDGAFWIVWGQESRSLHAQPEPEGASPDVGLFCKCVAADGHIIVPPTRVVPSVFEYVWRFGTMIVAPDAFVAMPKANGGVVVFSAHPKDYPVDPGDRAAGIETGQTDFMSVDRKGREKQVILDHLTSWEGEQFAGAFWSWEDSTGVMHCILMPDCVFPGPAVRCVTVAQGVEGDELQAGDILYYPATSLEDSAYFIGKHPGMPVRRDLAWTWDGTGYSGIAQLGNGALLVVYDVPRHNRDVSPLDSHVPGDTLAIYRLRASDLLLIDSTRVVATLVAGRDYVGLEIPRASLQKSTDGYVFYVGENGNTRSYSLDASGKPVLGDRALGAVGSGDSCPEPVQQFVSVSMFKPGHPEVPPQVHWFGISKDGRLCHEICTLPDK
jgi:hypothetical protein